MLPFITHKLCCPRSPGSAHSKNIWKVLPLENQEKGWWILQANSKYTIYTIYTIYISYIPYIPYIPYIYHIYHIYHIYIIYTIYTIYTIYISYIPYEPYSYTCSREYFESLEVVCERGSKDNYGLLNWTVAEETDDIVYYQSYTHEVRERLTKFMEFFMKGTVRYYHTYVIVSCLHDTFFGPKLRSDLRCAKWKYFQENQCSR